MNGSERSANNVLIIAEVGSVHDGSFGNALKLIESASKCGVDAVKFQTHIASAETLPHAPMPPYFMGEPRFQYFERTGFSKQQWIEIKHHCHENNVLFISSPFSIEAVELLVSVGVDRYKIGSGEITNLPMLERIGATHVPVLLSSGMSNWEELDEAVSILRKYHENITVLQCTSEYPCAYENVGLNLIAEIRTRYSLEVGLSDHTLTNYASFAAVTLGAVVIERHFAFSRLMYGSDARHSLEPGELSDLVNGIRAIEVMRSVNVDKDETASRLIGMKSIFEKSIVSIVDIPKGTTISANMVGLKKPGTGLPAKRMLDVIGKVALRDIPADSLINEVDLRA